jgi:hypothetical protein
MRIVGIKPFSSAANTAEIGSTIETAAKAQFTITRNNVQWPIYPPGTSPPEIDQPLIGSQSFDTGTGAIRFLKADRVFLDAATFTGDKNMPAVYDPDAVMLSPPENSTGTVMQHVNLTCT